jgi:eukaryotic-like serine/threonine-protein kinase
MSPPVPPVKSDQGPVKMKVPDPMEGTPYRRVRSIASGAMGDVIEAEHRHLGKHVVVKLIRLNDSHPAAVAAMEDRFRLEAQALASLDRHPNIVQVFDSGRTADGRLYLVMEQLRGKTLQDELGVKGAFHPIEAVRLTAQILAGLEGIHAAGLVHRDIKPSNLFLCDAEALDERVIKILDFGIVKLLSEPGHGPSPLAVQTSEGMTLGTPRYLAPEQARGKPVDSRADLYSVGAVLYWMLTGQDVFHDRDSEVAVMIAHVNDAPKPASRASRFQISCELDQAILKALSKNPSDRFLSAAQFRLTILSAVTARQRWEQTEPMNTSMFRAAGRGGTEPLNTSMFRPQVGHGGTEPMNVSRFRDVPPVSATASPVPGAASYEAEDEPTHRRAPVQPPAQQRPFEVDAGGSGGGHRANLGQRAETPRFRAAIGLLVIALVVGLAGLVGLALALRAAAGVG